VLEDFIYMACSWRFSFIPSQLAEFLVTLPAVAVEEVSLSLLVRSLLGDALFEHALAEIVVSGSKRLWTASLCTPRYNHHHEGHQDQDTLGKLHAEVFAAWALAASLGLGAN
jgi:hypothetical protein